MQKSSAAARLGARTAAAPPAGELRARGGHRHNEPFLGGGTGWGQGGHCRAWVRRGVSVLSVSFLVISARRVPSFSPQAWCATALLRRSAAAPFTPFSATCSAASTRPRASASWEALARSGPPRPAHAQPCRAAPAHRLKLHGTEGALEKRASAPLAAQKRCRGSAPAGRALRQHATAHSQARSAQPRGVVGALWWRLVGVGGGGRTRRRSAGRGGGGGYAKRRCGRGAAKGRGWVRTLLGAVVIVLAENGWC